MFAEYDSRLTIQYNIHKGVGSWYVFDKRKRPSSHPPTHRRRGEGHWSGEEAHEYIFDTFEEVSRWVENVWEPAKWEEDNK